MLPALLVAILYCGKSRGQFDRVHIRHSIDVVLLYSVVLSPYAYRSIFLALGWGNQERRTVSTVCSAYCHYSLSKKKFFIFSYKSFDFPETIAASLPSTQKPTTMQPSVSAINSAWFSLQIKKHLIIRMLVSPKYVSIRQLFSTRRKR